MFPDSVLELLKFWATLLDPGEVPQSLDHELPSASVGKTGLILAMRFKKWIEIVLLDGTVRAHCSPLPGCFPFVLVTGEEPSFQFRDCGAAD